MFKVKNPNPSSLHTYLLIISLCIFAYTCGPQKKKEVEGPVIGIDLGTTYSCVGIFKNGRVEIIPNEFGNRITPSFVGFTDEERLVGESAKNQAHINPKRSVYVVKRLMGRQFDDKEV
jgi:heat shock protein 5